MVKCRLLLEINVKLWNSLVVRSSSRDVRRYLVIICLCRRMMGLNSLRSSYWWIILYRGFLRLIGLRSGRRRVLMLSCSVTLRLKFRKSRL